MPNRSAAVVLRESVKRLKKTREEVVAELSAANAAVRFVEKHRDEVKRRYNGIHEHEGELTASIRELEKLDEDA